MTCAPLYVPQDGQTRCGSTGSLHFGHLMTLTPFSLKLAARRRSRRMLLVRFFGTPTVMLLLAPSRVNYFVLNLARPAHRGSGTERSQPQAFSFRLPPQTVHSPWQSSLQTG